jgi:hypothetical protein
MPEMPDATGKDVKIAYVPSGSRQNVRITN